jgi:YidC/Oxa1 family membrane protein insertase
MIAFHTLFSPVFGKGSGVTWTLSIVGLVVVIRIILIPLFVKQIRSSRGLQLLQPEIQKIQKKYKGKTDQESRQKQSQELMELYRKHGTNPFSSCLPILAQAPIFFALFRVLNGIALNQPRGVMTDELVQLARNAEFLGAPISVTFMNTFKDDFAGDAIPVRIVTLVLVVLMSASTFITQRQLMRKNMPRAH